MGKYNRKEINLCFEKYRLEQNEQKKIILKEELYKLCYGIIEYCSARIYLCTKSYYTMEECISNTNYYWERAIQQYDDKKTTKKSFCDWMWIRIQYDWQTNRYRVGYEVRTLYHDPHQLDSMVSDDLDTKTLRNYISDKNLEPVEIGHKKQELYNNNNTTQKEIENIKFDDVTVEKIMERAKKVIEQVNCGRPRDRGCFNGCDDALVKRVLQDKSWDECISPQIKPFKNKNKNKNPVALLQHDMQQRMGTFCKKLRQDPVLQDFFKKVKEL